LKFFGVKVADVKIIPTPTKTRVRGAHGPQLKRKTKKKAILCLAAGETFDILKLASAPKKPAKKAKETKSSVPA